VKKVSKQTGGFFEVFFNRKISVIFTRLLVNTPVTANQVSVFSFLLAIAAAYFLSTGIYKNLIIGGILVQLSFTFDCVDGEIARLKKLCSAKGAWLDSLFDRISDGILIFAVTFGLYNQTNNPFIWAYGFAGLIGVYMSSIVVEKVSLGLGKEKLSQAQSGFFIVKLLKKIGINPQYLALGIDVQMFVIALGAILNQLFLVLLFFAAIQNIYWILIAFLVGIRK